MYLYTVIERVCKDTDRATDELLDNLSPDTHQSGSFTAKQGNDEIG